MAIAFSFLAVVFVAFCMWLTVRIVNRREKWAKRLAVAIILVTMYPLAGGLWMGFVAFRLAPGHVMVLDLDEGFFVPISKVLSVIPQGTKYYSHFLLWCMTTGRDIGIAVK